MSRLVEPLAHALRNAREAKGISQRELSVNSAVPQGHISKIENGDVDLRVSSLIGLARALDLELMLVPRRSIAAVRSIAGGAMSGRARDGQAARRVRRELARLQRVLDRLPEELSSGSELAELRRHLGALHRLRSHLLDHQVVREAVQAVNALMRDRGALDRVRRSSLQLRKLRDALAHGRMARVEAMSVRPAYGLDDDDG